MKKFLAVLAILSMTAQAKAGDYYPGSWGEISIPKDILTLEDYHRYENVRKTSLGVAVLGGVVALGLLKYSSDMKRKANRVVVNEPYLVMTPMGYNVYPVRQSSIEFRHRQMAKSAGARKAAVGAAVASLLLGTLTLSVTF